MRKLIIAHAVFTRFRSFLPKPKFRSACSVRPLIAAFGVISWLHQNLSPSSSGFFCWSRAFKLIWHWPALLTALGLVHSSYVEEKCELLITYRCISPAKVIPFDFRHFYRSTLCISAVFAVARCLSVTFVYGIRKAENIVILLSQPGSLMILVSFFTPSIGTQFQREPLQWLRQIHGVGKICDFRLKSPFYLGNGTR